MTNIPVLLADPNRLFREGLKRLLANSDFTVAHEGRGLGEILEYVREQRPKRALVLCDLAFRTGDQLKLLREIRATVPQVKVVVLADPSLEGMMNEARAAGANGFLVKDMSSEALMQSLLLVMLGEQVVPAPASVLKREHGASPAAVMPSIDNVRLSGRESDILRCIVKGLTNKVIARELNIAEATVKVHVRGLLRKVNAANRTQAAIWAMNHGSSPDGDGAGLGR
jgi:two-component system nitrate/nitrite response regulator NarL